VTDIPVQPLLFEDCARTRRRVALDTDSVRVTFRVSRKARDEALKVEPYASNGGGLSEMTRDAWYQIFGIGELEGD
jgi:hypothetical protein